MGFCANIDGPQRINPADFGHTQQVNEWIGAQFGTYIHGPQWMNPTDWSYSVYSSSAPPTGQKVHVSSEISFK